MAETLDYDELEKFGDLGEAWWDPEGPMRPLHLLQPTRMAWIREQAVRHFGRDPKARRPLEGLRALDVGCGGGLSCEPLARLGARVVGIDPIRRNIEVAREHARGAGLSIDYRIATVEDLYVRHETFDLVLALEVVEHVPDPAEFLGEVAGLVAPGGMLILSTLSRTLRALLLGVLAAEFLLGWLPPGTHDWRRFLKPSEVAAMLRAHGLLAIATTGLVYDPAHERFERSRDLSVNYMLAAVRPPEGAKA